MFPYTRKGLAPTPRNRLSL